MLMPRARKTSLCVKYFLCKCEDLSLIPKDSSEEKARSNGTHFNTRDGEAETFGSQESNGESF